MASRTARIVASAGLALAVLGGVAASPAGATTGGTTEGCTPGYWKNHTNKWQEYSPTQTVSSVFSGATGTFGSQNLLSALQGGGGGSGVSGATTILLRAATAALLNASYDPLLFPWRRDVVGEGGRPALIPTVNTALASGNRDSMLSLASRLDTDNNLGCPLN